MKLLLIYKKLGKTLDRDFPEIVGFKSKGCCLKDI